MSMYLCTFIVGVQASVRCLGHWGKLLEIGKVDILDSTPLSMRPMLNNISFEGVDVDRVMNHEESTEVQHQSLVTFLIYDLAT